MARASSSGGSIEQDSTSSASPRRIASRRCEGVGTDGLGPVEVVAVLRAFLRTLPRRTWERSTPRDQNSERSRARAAASSLTRSAMMSRAPWSAALGVRHLRRDEARGFDEWLDLAPLALEEVGEWLEPALAGRAAARAALWSEWQVQVFERGHGRRRVELRGQLFGEQIAFAQRVGDGGPARVERFELGDAIADGWR